MHKVRLMYFKILKQKEMFGLSFSGLNKLEKGMSNGFSEMKLTSKLCLMYLHVKLQQNRCACYI